MSSKTSVYDVLQGDLKAAPQSDLLDSPHLDHDIESVPSDSDDIQSLASSKSLSALGPEDQIAMLLAQRNELLPIHTEALAKVGMSRFINNYRRLLKRYFLDLSQHAHSNLERTAINVLRRRSARMKIARSIAYLIEPKDEGPEDVIKDRIRVIEEKRVYTEHWIANNQHLTTTDDPAPRTATSHGDDEHFACSENSDDVDSHSEDDSEDDEDKLFEVTKLPRLTELEGLFTNGSPFESLLINLYNFLTPSYLAPLTRTLLSIPRNQIDFSSKEDLTPMDKVKLLIEDFTNDNWNWWPLQPPLRPLKEGETRLKWKCVSSS